MPNIPISAFTVPANTVGIGATGYSLTGSASASFVDLAGTWNTSGTPTAIKLNITDTASNAASLLMDLQVGGASQASIDKRGTFTFAAPASGTAPSRPGVGNWFGSLALFGNSGTLAATVSNTAMNFGTSYQLAWNLDLILTRRGAANLRLGAADAATPVAQTLSVQSVVAGTTNTAGTNLTITGSQGTGTGAGGSLIFQVAPAGSSGSAQNALATALTIGSDRNITMWGNGAAFYFESASGFEYSGSGTIAVRSAGARMAAFKVTGSGQVCFSVGAVVGFTSGAAESTSLDTILAREAAGVTGVRGANTTTGGALGFIEQTAPAAPAANGVRIYAVDNGSGKTQLMALFATGAAQQIAIEP